MNPSFDKPPIGKERKEDAVRSRQYIESELRLARQGLARDLYATMDSGLDQESEGTPLFWSFQDVLPEGTESLQSYIENELRDRKGSAVGVDFGGPGSRIFSEFKSGFFEVSVGVTLIDPRLDEPNAEELIASDASRNHSVIVADLLQDDTYEKLNAHLDGRKADLILERMLGGWDHFPQDPLVFANLFQAWYKLLNTEELMLVEVPSSMNSLLQHGTTEMKRALKGLVEIDVSSRPTQLEQALRLRKLPGAPTELPAFSAKEIKRWAAS